MINVEELPYYYLSTLGIFEDGPLPIITNF